MILILQILIIILVNYVLNMREKCVVIETMPAVYVFLLYSKRFFIIAKVG